MLVLASAGYILYQLIYPSFTAYNLDIKTQTIIFEVGVLMKFALFGISMFIISYYNFTSERELAISKLSLQYSRQLKWNSDELRQLVHTFSHELKSPVRNVASFMQLLLKQNKEVLDPSSLEFVELSKTGAEKMAQQLDALLTYSNVGKNLEQPTAVDLNKMITRLNHEMQKKYGDNKDYILRAKILPVLKNVHADMIYTLFHQLVTNGLKFNIQTDPEIIIDYEIEGGLLTFSIKDNGIGIAAGYDDTIFQMFQQLHKGNEFEGTGIGLPICRKIAAYYNGQIWYKSILSKGSTFYFTLACTVTDKHTVLVQHIA